MPNCTDFLYKTQKINLYPQSRDKALVSLSIKTLTNVCVKIITDTTQKIYNFLGSSNVQKIVLSMKCNSFEIEISGNAGADISVFDIDYSYVGEN